MTKRTKEILARLDEAYGTEYICYLNHETPWQLLIAVILSAQCTDARVNLVTPALFTAYPTLEAFATADIADVENYVHSCGFYKHKARDIVLGCQMLLSDYDRKVPDTMEKLLRIPGVGRKTANLVCGDIYGKPAVVTDTHFIRLCNRLGLVSTKDPLKVENAMRLLLPHEKSNDFCHRAVLFGRDICSARNPKCESCPLNDFCPKEKY